MAKITLILCDIKPCRLPAEREFDFNGQKIYVCGENCFVKFWSREYSGWKEKPYGLEATFHKSPDEAICVAEEIAGTISFGLVRSSFQVLK